MSDAVSLKLPKRRSLVILAILGLIIVVFSYLFTFLLGIACLVLPFIAIARGFGGVQTILVLIVGVIMGVTILWSLIPRREPFNPIGVKIDLSKHPRLASMVRNIAVTLGEQIPGEVYLLSDANAWVMERTIGAITTHKKRVLGFGLPLMQALTIREFRAVLAHEFAHFFCGDTRLGPRIYKTRSAMARVIQNLGSRSMFLDFLRRFAWANLVHTLVVGAIVAYWKLFLRITQLISRRQEYRSDELACHLAGSEAFIEGLQKVHTASAALDPFWKAVVNAAISAGYRPPLADGFARFIAAPVIKKAVSISLESALKQSQTSPYDTHPPLKSRIEAARRIRAETGALDERAPATTLLDNLDELEAELLQTLAPKLNVEQLKSMDWDTAGPQVYVPMWRNFVAQHSQLLDSRTVASLPDAVKDLQQIGAKIPDPQGMLLTREQRAERAAALLSTALSLSMIDSGWVLRMQPGEFYLERQGEKAIPGELLQSLRSGAITLQAWVEWCQKVNLENAPLNPPHPS